MHLPIFFEGQHLRCLVVGGGASVVRKVELFVEAGAMVTIIAPEADFKILVLSSLSRVKFEQRSYQKGDCEGFDLLIIGGENGGAMTGVTEDARRHTVPVNVCGHPELSTFFFPASMREGNLTVAVSSGGAAPFMSVEFARRLTSAVKGWGPWIDLAGRFRRVVQKGSKDPAKRLEYYERFIATGPFNLDPAPSENTSLSEWAQILRFARHGSKEPSQPAEQGDEAVY